jgi:hypothetical protein
MNLINQLHPLLEGADTQEADRVDLLKRLVDTSPKDHPALNDKLFWESLRDDVLTGRAVLLTTTTSNSVVGIFQLEQQNNK